MKTQKLTAPGEFRAICMVMVVITAYLIWSNVRFGSPDLSTIPEVEISTDTLPDNGQSNQPAGTAKNSRRTQINSARSRTSQYPSGPQRAYTKKKKSSQRTAEVVRIDCRPFDPNTVQADSLISWGLPVRIARNMEKYVGAGGQFRSHEDLARIYNMDTTCLRQLVECAIFEARAEKKYRQEVSSICINSASVEEFTKLRGIGDVLASRIVKFRDKLGGFVSVSQIADTYGLPPETFAQIETSLQIKSGIEQIAINEINMESLASHPYVTFRQARAITNYVDNHGALTSSDDLLNIHSLDSGWVKKVEPYFDWSEPIVVVAIEE